MPLDHILAEVRTMLTEIIGAEYALSLNIGMETSFDADLELESMEFVRLATMLTERYGDRVDFVVFLADKELEEIVGLTVGEVVVHIASCVAFAGAVDG
ncbi:MAG: acyl carrier protein [Actinobacteria bacterium]|nr:acyl carrier protein [Actinomycetota bacterium]